MIDDILFEVTAERKRQDNKWGVQNHDPFIWLAIIGEEFGEASKSALQSHFDDEAWLPHYRMELIHVAASAVAAIECIDRAAAIRRGDANDS